MVAGRFNVSRPANRVSCGRQSCLQAAFQAAVPQTTHAVRSYFLRLRVSQASCSEAGPHPCNDGSWWGAEVMKAKYAKADAVDPNFLNHITWYSAADRKRPYPGESKVGMPGRFVKLLRNIRETTAISNANGTHVSR